MNHQKRLLVVSLIILGSIGAGLLLNWGWNKLDRAAHPQDFRDLTGKYAEQYDVPEDLILAVIKVESEFDPNAESSVGARGLMQMMPSTFEWLTGKEHLCENLSAQKLYDPEVSIRYGTYYLRYLYQKFDCNWETALAAYNGGEGNVAKWLNDPQYSDADGNLTYIPFKETRNYVQKVSDAREMYQNLYFEEKEGTLS